MVILLNIVFDFSKQAGEEPTHLVIFERFDGKFYLFCFFALK
jgi:hypothetical protein